MSDISNQLTRIEKSLSEINETILQINSKLINLDRSEGLSSDWMVLLLILVVAIMFMLAYRMLFRDRSTGAV